MDQKRLDEIDDKIDEWHDNPNLTMPLHEYLGMTWEEYKKWVENPGFSRRIKTN